ncbi:hypothetical protein RRU94_02420 [Domibacillus sp. DTU_2020_1001157_1_SI_ALB_TIR_016]|uniref:hypothetical protein n=1 Tax=Domibacillus sp. DTU_2020_1001157_1_SI_ALB_TIR_016 TaxID=3077789 RepID=UPI0028E828E6|nr:hypothetical protein [Domibacillus sp. DTU_2020_1001157_1_SI_ALB_TIR_016]WNS78819.1 hypothetical protein RRU94_02420 [Domibacillus sp. DTU_2020_1001157_1_SI_ALB_TIR_016]
MKKSAADRRRSFYNSEEKMIKKIFVIGILLPILSALITLATASETNVENSGEFRNAKFGFPFSFITQDLAASGAGGYEGGFPRVFSREQDFLDNDPEIEFDLTNYILSCIVIYICVLPIAWAFNFLFWKMINLEDD